VIQYAPTSRKLGRVLINRLLLLLHTGRIRMFGASAPDLMEAYVKDRIAHLREE
jgi:hypothetical protein